MSITSQGMIGEQEARLFLKSKGYSLFEIDWIASKGGNDLQVEVKHKDKFEPPPFAGHGMEVWKVRRRLDFEHKYGIKAFLLVFDTDKSVYGQFISKLEENIKDHFDTRNGIRVYKIDNFIKFSDQG
jgi:hypothetical protein